MRRLATLATLALLSTASAVEAAQPRCGAGRTLFVDGELRIFAVTFKEGRYASGSRQYACLGREGRGIPVGGSYSDATLTSSTTPAYVFDGDRYLVSYETSDSEGGPDAGHTVTDLRRRRVISFVSAPYDDPFPPFRVSGAGELLTNYGDVRAFRRGEERLEGRVLSTPGENATALALTGATAYWSEGAAARSTTLQGPPADGENHLLAPVKVPRGAGGPCVRRGGRTIARTGRVRVMRSHGRRLACRVGKKRFLGLPAGAVRVLADRWVVAEDDDVTLLDTRSGEVVTRAAAPAEWTLLAGGTLAWTTAEGVLLEQDSAADAPTMVAEGASALASSGRTLYWTAAGAPHRLR